MKKITPHLWFDTKAKEAADLYTSAFKNSKITNSVVIHNTPSGDADILTIELAGQEFILINAGPYFKFTPAISFLVGCESKEEVDEIWKKLSPGGMALMELGSYPFSEKYGWTQDKFGLSWQIMFMDKFPMKQKITPTLMFVGKQCGRAEEAIKFYTSIFNNSKIGEIHRYGKNEGLDKEDTIKHAGFTLDGQVFAAMDSAYDHKFGFNEAISFLINCEDQKEVDYYWEKLSAVPEAEQCGWLKDKFGLSWQVNPVAVQKMLHDADRKKVDRVTAAFLKMKKFDIAALKKAFEGT